MPSPPATLETRERLLLAAVDVFGRHGFAGTSTRMLAAAAGANLQAIPYYFDSKEGLYLAAAKHIADRILERLAASREHVRARLARGPLQPKAARELLAEMLEALAGMLLEDDSAAVARFIVREQMEASPAFDHIYERVMEPQLQLARRIVGQLLGADPRSTRVRLRTLALVGSVVFLRTGHATAMRQLGWSEVGSRESAAIRALIEESTASLHHIGSEP
jgi:TetR/AcrR family transcriptional regulator, regulator of cefoperazone and chloramphenicol sensitivity